MCFCGQRQGIDAYIIGSRERREEMKTPSLWSCARPAVQALFAFIIVFGLFFAALPVQADTIYSNPGWSYYRSIPIYGSSSGAQTNYQKLIRVYKGSENATNISTGENIAQYTVNADANDDVYGINYRAQTFTSSENVTAKKVWLKLVKVGTPVTSLACALRATSAGAPTGSNLCSGNITSSFISTTADWYEFDLGVGTPLTAGTQYSIILYSDNSTATTSNEVAWAYDSTLAPYTAGNGYYSANSGSTWTARAEGYDHMFQVVATTTGVIPFAVYCNNHCTDNFSDIRFVAADNMTILDIWQETTIYGSYSDFWVEIPSIPAMTNLLEGTRIGMFYGNPSAPTVSNGANTFPAFDDFEWGANTTALSTSGGSLVWTSASGQISTTTAYGGTRSASSVTTGSSVFPYSAVGITAASFSIYYRFYNGSTGNQYQSYGNGTSRTNYTFDSARNILNNAGGVIGTYTGSSWQLVEVRRINFTAATSELCVNGVSIVPSDPMATSAAYNGTPDINTAGGTALSYFDNVIIKAYAVSLPLFGVAGAESAWVPPLQIEDCKVVQGFKTAGDWLVVCRYKDVFTPYYPTADVKRYFAIQLIDPAGTVLTSNPISEWGNRIGSVYLSPAQVTSLDWNGAYKVRIQGLFTGTPYTEYSLVASDWLGTDLTYLDSWAITSATVMQAYDTAQTSTTKTYVTNIATRGACLSATGGDLLVAGIPGLQTVRPTLFQIYTKATEFTSGTGTATNINSIRAGTATAIGPDAVVAFQRFGTDVAGGLPYNYVIAIVALLVCFGLAAASFPFGHTTVANIICLGVLFAFGYFGFDWIWLLMVYIVSVFLLAKKLWIDTGI